MMQIPDLSPEDIRKYMKECLIENNLDLGLMDSQKKGVKGPTEKEEGCFLACMDKKMGLMKDNGSYNEDIFLSGAQSPEHRSEMKRKFDATMKKCKIEAIDDVCKFAACVNRQPYDLLPRSTEKEIIRAEGELNRKAGDGAIYASTVEITSFKGGSLLQETRCQTRDIL
ncbi:uncharacterized protein LOC106642509 [Copidosoma floridanum]|uniref:uncharacterized protein LOC106642509 n=1 Tax=Copidosoma floridanum TaxID=29053 RepID=UPI0006C9E121|nr:uncharacterized protein LOC106642509 [Copidosoma floridanum]